ncbi:MAG: cell envelope integrity protein CreD, partial [Nitrospirota bacterium]
MEKIRSSVGIRLIVIGVLSLLLLIPAAMIERLIYERERTRNGAVGEVSEKWGGNQLLSGPVLTIPLKEQHKDDKGNITTSIQYAHFLPDELSIQGDVSPQIRRRGIYEVVLYNGKLNVMGSFSRPIMDDLGIQNREIMWKDAFISLGITDMKGIKDTIKIKWNDSDLAANPGIKSNDVLCSGVSTKVELNETGKTNTFSFAVDLNGSQELKFIPVGKETRVVVSSSWPAPSFQGGFLPEKREVTKNGFTAEWKVLQLNRNYPQKWLGKHYEINSSAFGVNLLMPVDHYQKTMRTVKYALLFIGLTFMSFFVIETLTRKPIHPIQYLLIGIAMILFYSLLLSLSEHIGFGYSYLTASFCTVFMVTAYSKSVLLSKITTTVVFSILSILYGFLYVL